LHTDTQYNERELLVKTAAGDEAAFTQLFYAYHNKLGEYIMRLTESVETTQEIVLDVFVKVWTKRESLATVERFGPYIYVLSRNHTLNCLRQLSRERMKTKQVVENIEASYRTADPLEASVPDYYNLIDQAIEELPPQQQKAYILSRHERLKYEEIAQRMNISKETVKTYLKLAIRFITGYVRSHRDAVVILYFIAFSLSFI